jgi:Zn-dependent protease with chaperone function
MNFLKTILLLGILSALMVGIGGVLGGRDGMTIAFVIALVTNVGSYWFSAPMALRMSGAQPIDRAQAPELYQVVESLCQKANLPMPTIHMIPTQSANAFATGRQPLHIDHDNRGGYGFNHNFSRSQRLLVYGFTRRGWSLCQSNWAYPHGHSCPYGSRSG